MESLGSPVQTQLQGHPPLTPTLMEGVTGVVHWDLGQEGTAHRQQEEPYASLEPELHALTALPGRQGPGCEGELQQEAAGQHRELGL